jgi:hypothetical protein
VGWESGWANIAALHDDESGAAGDAGRSGSRGRGRGDRTAVFGLHMHNMRADARVDVEQSVHRVGGRHIAIEVNSGRVIEVGSARIARRQKEFDTLFREIRGNDIPIRRGRTVKAQIDQRTVIDLSRGGREERVCTVITQSCTATWRAHGM